MDQEASQPSTPGPTGAAEDVDKAKGTAWLSYIGILWLIPLLTMKDSPFAKFHVKQGIVLSIYAVGVSIVGSIIPFVGWFVILPVGSILVLIFAIMGIINAAGGKWWKCPMGVSALAEKFTF